MSMFHWQQSCTAAEPIEAAVHKRNLLASAFEPEICQNSLHGQFDMRCYCCITIQSLLNSPRRSLQCTFVPSPSGSLCLAQVILLLLLHKYIIPTNKYQNKIKILYWKSSIISLRQWLELAPWLHRFWLLLPHMHRKLFIMALQTKEISWKLSFPESFFCRWTVLFIFGHLRDVFRKKILGDATAARHKEVIYMIRHRYGKFRGMDTVEGVRFLCRVTHQSGRTTRTSIRDACITGFM